MSSFANLLILQMSFYMNTLDETYLTTSGNDVRRFHSFLKNSKILLIINGEWPRKVGENLLEAFGFFQQYWQWF